MLSFRDEKTLDRKGCGTYNENRREYIMSVSTIEERIKPLTIEEKRELYRFLEKELEHAEILEHVTPGATYDIVTPYGQDVAAQQLVKHVEEQG
jgi:hypothetical protein